jgi:hypothetical protein
MWRLRDHIVVRCIVILTKNPERGFIQPISWVRVPVGECFCHFCSFFSSTPLSVGKVVLFYCLGVLNSINCLLVTYLHVGNEPPYWRMEVSSTDTSAAWIEDVFIQDETPDVV